MVEAKSLERGQLNKEEEKDCFHLHHLLLCTLKAVRNEVDWLVLCDWVFLQPSLLRVKRSQFRFSWQILVKAGPER